MVSSKGKKTNPFAALAFHQVGLLFFQKTFNWFGGVLLFSLSGNFVINEVGSTQRGRDVHNYNKFSWSQRALEQNNLDLKSTNIINCQLVFTFLYSSI